MPTDSINENNLEDLMDQLWPGGNSWTDTSLTISFPQEPTQWWLDQGLDPDDYTGFNAFQIITFNAAAQLWADLADITMTSIGAGGTGQIRAFGWARPDATWAAKVGSSPGINTNMDVQFNTNEPEAGGAFTDNLAIMQYGMGGFRTAVHEIGHTLGISHPGNYDIGDEGGYDGLAEYIEDTQMYSTMSYWSAGITGADYNGATIDTPQLHDIYVVQNIYGPDLTTRSGDTRYGYNAAGLADYWEVETYDFTENDDPVLAIWDAGGHDTLDLSGDASGVELDLRPGYFSSTHGMTFNIVLAYNPDPAAYPNLDHFIEDAEGGAGNDTIYGNDLGNEMRGNDGDDALYGFAGDDELYGGGGDDELYGGNLGDFLLGGGGDDRLEGGSGNDTLNGSLDNDWLIGGNGTDTLWGGSGEDTADYSYSDADFTVDLDPDGAYNGTAVAGPTVETVREIEHLVMGGGDDTLRGSGLRNIINAGGGNDDVEGLGGNDILSGEGGGDTLDGGSGNDLVEGGDGNDVLAGGPGDDQIYGGANVDMVNYAGAAGFVLVDLAIGALQFVGPTEGYDIIVGVENLTGSGVNDELRGNDASNLIYGIGGDDIIEGRGGNEVLNGGIGVDEASYESAPSGVTVDLLLSGGPQNTGPTGIDTLISFENLSGSAHGDLLAGDGLDNEIRGRDGNDFLFGRIGDDELIGGDGDDFLVGGPDDDFISGSDGVDTVSYFTAPSGVSINLLDIFARDTGGAGIDTVRFIENADGSAFADTIAGDNGDNLLQGLDGADALAGRDGNDVLNGGSGADVLEGGAGADVLNGGFSTDIASYAGAASGIEARLSTGLGSGGDAEGDTYLGIENLMGSAFADVLVGDDATGNVLIGGGGDDTLLGRAGSDTLVGGQGDDLLDGGAWGDAVDGAAGSDTVSYHGATTQIEARLTTGVGLLGHANGDTYSSIENLIGSAFNDTLVGSHAVNNQLAGGAGNDVMIGNSGNDILTGGLGRDTLLGGTNNDAFVFASAADSAVGANRDVIHDFEDTGENDSIVLTGFAGVLSFIGTAAFSAANQVRAVQSGADVLVQINTVGIAAAESEILLANTNLAQVDASDFFL